MSAMDCSLPYRQLRRNKARTSLVREGTLPYRQLRSCESFGE